MKINIDSNIVPFIKELGFQDRELGKQVVASAELLVDHSLFRNVDTIRRLQCYMEHQVWCVWDFMSLAKSIQIRVNPVAVPWVPPKDPEVVALMNDIITGEEADIGPDGAYSSHFEIFRNAMNSTGCDTRPIDDFLKSLATEKKSTLDALQHDNISSSSREFVQSTFELASLEIHETAAAFCLGRELAVPNMFEKFRPNLPSNKKADAFRWYLNRHVELDSEQHGPKCIRMVKILVGDDAIKAKQALEAGDLALKYRKRYLDAILNQVERH
jgi:hypothetical protein